MYCIWTLLLYLHVYIMVAEEGIALPLLFSHLQAATCLNCRSDKCLNIIVSDPYIFTQS